MPRAKRNDAAKARVEVADSAPSRIALAASSTFSATIAEIKHWHRQRVFAMDQRKRSDLALGAFMRTQLGWSRALPATEAAKIAKRAADLVTLGEKVAKGKATGIDDSAFGQWSPVILASIHGRAHWDAIEATATKEMERLASSLPVWAAFGEGVKGFGPRSLAVIVGEAGDIGSYATVAKLWKRMGLAVMNGVRQGGLRKTASAEDWIAHGYSARRRSYMFVIGDVLVKNQGVYREVYLTRKDDERKKAKAEGLTVAPSAKIPAARKHEFRSDGHIHKRSQRYMEKRLLRDLWQAWRRTSKSELPKHQSSAAISSAQAVPSAIEATPTKVASPEDSIRQTSLQSLPNDNVSAVRSANPALPTMVQERSATHSAQAEPSTIITPATVSPASKVLTRQTKERTKPVAPLSGSRSAIVASATDRIVPGASIQKRRTNVNVKPDERLSAKRSATTLASTKLGSPRATIPAKAGRSASSVAETKTQPPGARKQGVAA